MIRGARASRVKGAEISKGLPWVSNSLKRYHVQRELYCPVYNQVNRRIDSPLSPVPRTWYQPESNSHELLRRPAKREVCRVTQETEEEIHVKGIHWRLWSKSSTVKGSEDQEVQSVERYCHCTENEDGTIVHERGERKEISQEEQDPSAKEIWVGTTVHVSTVHVIIGHWREPPVQYPQVREHPVWYAHVRYWPVIIQDWTGSI